jgi:hypothetical protein
MTEDRMSVETAPQSAKSGGRSDRNTWWLLIAIAIYSGVLVTLLNAVILPSSKVNDRAIFLMADGLILFRIVIGGSLTPVLRRRLVPRIIAIPMDWRVRFVLLCTAMALFEDVITTTMTNLAPLLGTKPERPTSRRPPTTSRSSVSTAWSCSCERDQDNRGGPERKFYGWICAVGRARP